MPTMSPWIEIAEQAARHGAEQLMSWRGRFTAREKAPRDLVTEADLASQEAIEAFLARQCPPDHAFLGEEDPDLGLLRSADSLWVVDPLDGTTNYVHGMNAFAVSVALVQQGRVVAGVVLDPVADECFAAAAGAGATVNGHPLRTSDCRDMDMALIAASFPPRVAPGSAEERRFLTVLRSCQAVRRIGAAALNLAYVAAGRLDGYWATSVKAWDVAAGFLLVQEAGGQVTDLRGQAADLCDPQFIAAAPGLHGQLQETLDDA